VSLPLMPKGVEHQHKYFTEESDAECPFR